MIGDRVRVPLSSLLDDIDRLSEEVEEIMGARPIALDGDISAKLRDSVARIDRNKESIPDWRDTLDFVPD